MRRLTALLAATGLVVASLVFVAPTSPASAVSEDRCANRTNDTIKKLLACVKLDGVRAHQAALQAIADANGGIRASGTAGYDASVDYAVGVFEDAGYDVTVQPFHVLHLSRLAVRAAADRSQRGRRTSSDGLPAVDQTDPGDVTAAVTPSTSSWSRQHVAPAAARRPTSPASRPATSR